MSACAAEMLNVLYIDTALRQGIDLNSSCARGVMENRRVVSEALKGEGYGVVSTVGLGPLIYEHFFKNKSTPDYFAGMVTHFPSGVVGGVTSYEVSEGVLRQIRGTQSGLAIVVYTGCSGEWDDPSEKARLEQMILQAGADTVVFKSDDFSGDAERVVRALGGLFRKK